MAPPRRRGLNGASQSNHTPTQVAELLVEIDASSPDPMEKDEAEEELERLVFGNESGFRDALKSRKPVNRELALLEDNEAEDGETQSDGEEGLGDVDDADLFFLDSGPETFAHGTHELVHTSDSEDSSAGKPKAAWEDSDDERITVSLANNSRLRKLRVSEAEDFINGKEYTKRLRRQYERLYPTPDWANPSARSTTRRRKSDACQNASSDDSDNDLMDTDGEEETTARPLGKLLQSISDLTRDEERPAKKRKLRQDVIDIQRTKDVGGIQPSSVDCLTFHPHHPILLSSGPSSTASLHHISPSTPTPNPLLTTLHIRHTPFHTAVVHPSGAQIFLSGRRRYLHAWNLASGTVTKLRCPPTHAQDQKTMECFKISPSGTHIGLVGSSRKGGGVINILDASTLQWTTQVRVDSRGGIADFAWWSSSTGLTVAGKSGEVSEYDLETRRIVSRWADDGAVGTTVLAMGGKSGRTHLGGDRWIAIGSSSGIANIYDRRSWATNSNSDSNSTADSNAGVPPRPKPTRTFDQLVTPISSLAFSRDGQILALASRWKKDALRLVHLPSCTVYRNWPTSNTPLGRVTSVAFSPGSDMLAAGNEQGKIRLWEIRG